MTGTQLTDLGEIPETWEVISIGSFAVAAQYGLSIRGEQSGAYPILRMNCQVDGHVSLDNLQYVNLDEATFNNFRVNQGDILFNRTNSYELVGRSAIYGHDTAAVFASYLVRLSVDRSRVIPEYLNFLLNWPVAQRGLKKLASRGVSQANISASKLKEFKVHLPRPIEQVGITNVLESLRNLIVGEDDLCCAALRVKRTLSRNLFTRGLRGEAQKETEIGLLPESWTLATLGAHFSVVSGGTPSRDNPEYWNDGTIPWVKTTEIDYGLIAHTEEHITLAGLAHSAAKLLPEGTLLMAMYGQGVTRGRVAILGIEAACNQACAAMNPSDDAVDPRFLFQFLTYRYEAIRQMAHGGQQQNLNLEIVRDLPLAFPEDRSVQQEIIAILETIDRKIDLHKRKRAVLEDLFKALLHKLMIGEIRVADLDLSALGETTLETVA